MIYSDKNIRDSLASGHIIIDPISESQIQPASVDLRLGNHFIIPQHVQKMNFGTKVPTKSIFKPTFDLFPGKFILATTMERINLPLDVAAKIEGRSSVGRLGLIIHTAGYVDPGFNGQITLEIYNLGNSSIRLEAGSRICQIVFEELKDACEHGYSGKYQNQSGTTASRIYLDKEIVLKAKHEQYVLANENVDETNDISSDIETEEVTD